LRSYDLAIAYRIYPHVAKAATGLPFSEDKLSISEICLRSFKESLGNLRVKLWALLDGCPEEYTKLFHKYFDAGDLILVPLPGVGNRVTFGKQIEILLRQEDSDLIYFAEDDYFYLPEQFPLMLRFLRDFRGASLAHSSVDLSDLPHAEKHVSHVREHAKDIFAREQRLRDVAEPYEAAGA
jgi:hypothetical protein